jgi:hypothetical protein
VSGYIVECYGCGLKGGIDKFLSQAGRQCPACGSYEVHSPDAGTPSTPEFQEYTGYAHWYDIRHVNRPQEAFTQFYNRNQAEKILAALEETAPGEYVLVIVLTTTTVRLAEDWSGPT